MQRSKSRALFAGLLAGLAGSAVKAAGEWLYNPRTQGQTPPPVVLAERVAGHPLSARARQISMQGIHYGFGALAGAAYSVAAEAYPAVSAGYGSLFGIVLQCLTHESMVPAAGLDVPATRQPLREHASEFFTHILYGVATEAARQGLRKVI